MTETGVRAGATRPEDLNHLVVERLNAADVDGLVALYEPDAIMALPNGAVAHGQREIRAAFEEVVKSGVRFAPGAVQPPMINADVALTASRLVSGSFTVEVARRQPNGTWLWAIDQPNLTGS